MCAASNFDNQRRAASEFNNILKTCRFARKHRFWNTDTRLCQYLVRPQLIARTINRQTAGIELLAHTGGGVEIESQDTADFFRRDIVNEKFESLADELADYLDIADKTFLLQDIIENEQIKVAEEHGFKLSGHSLVLYGICNNQACRDSAK